MNNIKYKWYKTKYKDLNRGNVTEFSLAGKTKFCKVVDIINAQKCIIIMDLHGETHKWTLRLDGYKAHIQTDINKIKNQEEKITLTELSYQAHHFFTKLINASTDKIFKLFITGFDKQGCLLGYLYYPKHNPIDGISVNELMMSNHYGKESNNIINLTLNK